MLRSTARVCTTFLLLSICACSDSPTSPADFTDREIAALWAEGQQWLLNMNMHWTAAGEPAIRGDVRSVKHTAFLFVSHDEPLFLNGEQVGGFFEPGLRRIHYHEPLMNGVIPHEACHAILYELRDPRWHCACHDECNP